METNTLARDTYDTATLNLIADLSPLGDDRFVVMNDWGYANEWWAFLVFDRVARRWSSMVHDVEVTTVFTFGTEAEARSDVEEFVAGYEDAEEQITPA